MRHAELIARGFRGHRKTVFGHRNLIRRKNVPKSWKLCVTNTVVQYSSNVLHCRTVTKTRIIYQAKEYQVPIARLPYVPIFFFNFKVAFKELDKHLDL